MSVSCLLSQLSRQRGEGWRWREGERGGRKENGGLGEEREKLLQAPGFKLWVATAVEVYTFCREYGVQESQQVYSVNDCEVDPTHQQQQIIQPDDLSLSTKRQCLVRLYTMYSSHCLDHISNSSSFYRRVILQKLHTLKHSKVYMYICTLHPLTMCR